MGIFDKIFGNDPEPAQQPSERAAPGQTGGRSAGPPTDAQAIERYRYLLKTAPPDAIEQAHAEAFAQLSPEQRRGVLEQLSSDAPDADRGAATSVPDDPRSLARMATRAELRRPGTMERVFGGAGGAGGIGMGGLLAGSFLSSMAGMVIGSMVAQQFFDQDGSQSGLAESAEGEGSNDASTTDETGNDASADADMSGASEDFDGGDFGGGDFGGGDFDV